MPNKIQTHILILALLTCAFFGVSCGSKTEEDRIRELMKEAGQHIEKKDIDGLMSLLSEDYTDFRERDKTQTQDMVQTYFSEFRGIVIHVLSTRIDKIDPGGATIRTDAALSSGAAKALRKLVPVSTDNYRFDYDDNISGWDEIRTFTVEVKNTRDIPVKIEIKRNFNSQYWDLEKSGQFDEYEKIDLDTVKFTLTLQPQTKKIFEYTLTTRHGTRAE